MEAKTKELEFKTLAEFVKIVSENELEELDAIGDSTDAARWKVADKARLYIDEYEWPAMWVYALISWRTDRSATTVRHYCYVSRFYYDSNLRDQFHTLRFSIFKYASQVKKPLECLQYAHDNQLRRPGELVVLFEKASDIITPVGEVPPASIIPMWARPISRRIFDIQDEKKRSTAEVLLNSLLDVLNS